MTAQTAGVAEVQRAGRAAVTIIGAPSSIGIRPYDDGERARQLDRAPTVLRELGLVRRLGAQDAGDVRPPAYRDFVRPPDGVRNEAEVADYSRSLADRVAGALGGDRFPVVLGGDCSIVLGCLLGARRHAGRVGLAYIDGHADFGTPAESVTGSAASMCLADGRRAWRHGSLPARRLETLGPPRRRGTDRPA